MSELIDNTAFRVNILKHIIKELHAGVAPEQVRRRLAELVRETDSTEIAAMEQQLIAEGMPVAEVQSMCDLHSQVLRDVIVEREGVQVPPGHPVETFRRENEAVRGLIARMRSVFEQICARNEDEQAEEQIAQLRQLLNELMDLDKHYLRKEHLLFSCLERHGITGPSKVMWGKDDEVRDLLKSLGEALAATDATVAEWQLVADTIGQPALTAVEEMIYKEEKILLPMSLETLTEDEWGEVWGQSPEYGWCLVEPESGYQPPRAVGPDKIVELPQGRSVIFPTGALTFDQLVGVFNALPVDVTFVDADDRVRFFSEGAGRVFARSKAVIGRKVQHCHPPKSVGIVEQILLDFKSGRQDVAEFWINMGGRFVHIRYFAVKDSAGDYAGTLEVTQDLTRLRTLDGERRLLQYDPLETDHPDGRTS